MALSDMEVFNQYVMPASIEMLSQMIEKFNASSGGALQLSTEGFTGDFYSQSFFAGIEGTRRRVDRYAANNPVASTNLRELKETAVKVAGGIGPVAFEPSQLSWLRRPTNQGLVAPASRFAAMIMQDMLDSGLAAATAAITNQADSTRDVSGTGPITYAEMNSGHALFGDHSNSIVAWVMDGNMFHRLIGQNLTNVERLFVSQSVNVVDILGRLVVVTDSPALFQAGAPNKNVVLGLTQGAVTVYDGSDVISNVHTPNGTERIETTLQVDYSFGLRLKGYTWDEINGTKSPDDATLATGTNWDRVVTSHKHAAGIAVLGDAA